jgi:PAS domain S-box-containing protein
LNKVRLESSGLGFGLEALAELLENVPLAIAVTLGPEHRFVFANRLFRSAWASGAASLVGSTAADIGGELWTAEAQDLRAEVYESGEPRERSGAPLRVSSDRELTYWDVKLLPVLDQDQEVSGILMVAANASDRVKAEREAERQARAAAYENERLALAVEAAELGLWEWDVRSGDAFWSDRQKEIFGLEKDRPGSYAFWLAAIHPDDRDRVVAAVQNLLDPESGGQLAIEHRVVHPDGSVRWILSRGRMLYEIVDGRLQPARLLGTVLDITERRAAEESRQLLVRELNHRVKNLFAVASSLVSLTARSATTPKEMAASLRGRLDALSRAHELIRPAIVEDEPRQQATSIAQLVDAVMAPHAGQDGERLVAGGPSVPVGPHAATAVTLMLHELATNATKYGALSDPDGRIRITWMLDGTDVVVTWCEEGGPPVEEEPATTGFGSQLARKSVTGQLEGEVRYEWRREGLQVTMRLPLERLAQ